MREREFKDVYLHYLTKGLGLTLLTAVHNQAVVCEWDSGSSQGTAEICSGFALGMCFGAGDSGPPWEENRRCD